MQAHACGKTAACVLCSRSTGKVVGLVCKPPFPCHKEVLQPNTCSSLRSWQRVTETIRVRCYPCPHPTYSLQCATDTKHRQVLPMLHAFTVQVLRATMQTNAQAAAVRTDGPPHTVMQCCAAMQAPAIHHRPANHQTCSCSLQQACSANSTAVRQLCHQSSFPCRRSTSSNSKAVRAVSCTNEMPGSRRVAQ